MARIITSDDRPLDFCWNCFPSRADAVWNYETEDINDVSYFEYDAAHPDYEGLGYCCEYCGHELVREDN